MSIAPNDRRYSAARGAAGFTLVEMLVALMLVGLIAILAFGGIRLGTRAWHKAEDVSFGAEEIFATQTLLRRQVSQSYPAYADKPAGVPYVDFVGSADKLAFLSPAPRQLALGGLARMEIRVQDSGTQRNLVVRSRLDLADRSADDRPLPTLTGILLRDIRGVRFRYYGPIRPDVPSHWHDTWIAQPTLPQLVKIEVIFQDARRYWPELIVPLRVNVDAACIYDAISYECRRL